MPPAGAVTGVYRARLATGNAALLARVQKLWTAQFNPDDPANSLAAIGRVVGTWVTGAQAGAAIETTRYLQALYANQTGIPYLEVEPFATPAGLVGSSASGGTVLGLTDMAPGVYYARLGSGLSDQAAADSSLAWLNRVSSSEPYRVANTTNMHNGQTDDRFTGRFVRITRPGACSFCQTIADRGYTEANVGFAAHAHCHCTPEPEANSAGAKKAWETRRRRAAGGGAPTPPKPEPPTGTLAERRSAAARKAAETRRRRAGGGTTPPQPKPEPKGDLAARRSAAARKAAETRRQRAGGGTRPTTPRRTTQWQPRLDNNGRPLPPGQEDNTRRFAARALDGIRPDVVSQFRGIQLRDGTDDGTLHRQPNVLGYFTPYANAVTMNRWTYSATGQDAQLRSIAAGWHTPVNLPPGSAYQYTVTHEIGHFLDHQLTISQHVDVLNAIHRNGGSTALSRYAGKSDMESVAEAWAEYKLSPTPRPAAKAAGDLIMRYLGVH